MKDPTDSEMSEMSESGLTLAVAERILREFGGYDWALSGKRFWSISEVAEGMREAGLPIGEAKVRQLFNEVKSRWPAHWQDLKGTYGWRISRTGLILVLAAQTAEGQALDG